MALWGIEITKFKANLCNCVTLLGESLMLFALYVYNTHFLCSLHSCVLNRPGRGAFGFRSGLSTDCDFVTPASS